ncbi:MAG: hypothetical protein QM744_12410 [Mesorhizobium sp.]
MIDKLEAPALTRANKHTMKAQITNSTARAIIESEAAKREAKTLRTPRGSVEGRGRTPGSARCPQGSENRRRTLTSVNVHGSVNGVISIAYLVPSSTRNADKVSSPLPENGGGLFYFKPNETGRMHITTSQPGRYSNSSRLSPKTV